MAASSKAETVRVMLAAFCRGEAATAAGYFAEDGVLVSPTSQETRGRAAIEEHLRGWLAAFPDTVIESMELIEAGEDKIVALMTASAVHVGPVRGHAGTGKQWRLRFCEVYRFDADGLIARDDAFYDLHAMLQQLGLA
jgi:steroid delta-isomerase-like uncharacterized protein